MHIISPNGEDSRGAWLWGRTPWWGVSGVGLHQEGAIGGWVARLRVGTPGAMGSHYYAGAVHYHQASPMGYHGRTTIAPNGAFPPLGAPFTYYRGLAAYRTGLGPSTRGTCPLHDYYDMMLQ